VQKDTGDLTVFFALLGSAHAKAALKTLAKLTQGEFHQLSLLFEHKSFCVPVDLRCSFRHKSIKVEHNS